MIQGVAAMMQGACPFMRKPGAAMSPQLHSSINLGLLHGQEEAIKGSNFIFSPLLIRAGLGLLTGMLDEADQRSVLSFVKSPTLNDLNTASASLIDACRPSSDDMVLKISFANGIWADQRRIFEPLFQETAKSVYKAFIKSVDFPTQYPEVRTEINDWIETETGRLIKNFLPEGIPNCRTSYVLANALYFKGIWEREFTSGIQNCRTRVDKFYLLDEITSVEVPFMLSFSRLEFFAEYSDFKTLVLPYKKDNQDGRHFSMVIFLPNSRDGLLDLAKKASSDPTFIDDNLPKFKHTVARMMIPKFKISSKFEVTPLLQKMGLDIDSVDTLQGATIEVDEKGTTAAATMTSLRYCCSSGGRPPPAMEFIADHPFLFAIREDVSGAILFMGHVANPKLN